MKIFHKPLEAYKVPPMENDTDDGLYLPGSEALVMALRRGEELDVIPVAKNPLFRNAKRLYGELNDGVTIDEDNFDAALEECIQKEYIEEVQPTSKDMVVNEEMEYRLTQKARVTIEALNRMNDYLKKNM